jgi:hypothetical protein
LASDPAAAYKADNPDKRKVPNSVPGKEKVCSAVAIDLKTGRVTQGVNGKPADQIPPENLHPLLQQNYQDLRAYKHPTESAPGETSVTEDGKAHVSVPAQHAEVKATNELLWQRQSELPEGETLPPSTLNEMRFDPRWTGNVQGAGIGDPAPACANCNTILGGVPSYTGRFQYSPQDYRYQTTKIDPHED